MGFTCCIDLRNKANKKKIKESQIYSSYKNSYLEEKKYTKEELNKILPNFINQPLKFDEFYDKNDIDDEFFNEQKQYEKNELNTFFITNKNIIEDQIKSEINIINKNNLNIHDDLYIHKLVNDIICIEDGQKIYAEKIKKIQLKETITTNFSEIEKINYLPIILCGKSGVGKTTLINHILNSQNISNFDDDIKEYYNNTIPFFKFVKINLINQYPPNVFEEKKKIMNYITKQDRSKDINNKVRCIWYCFNNGTLIDEEIELIKSLKDYYNNNIPIMLVHTMSINNKQLDEINNLKINPEEVIKVLAMDYNDQTKGIYLNSFGIDILLNTTLFQWKKSIILNKASIRTKLNTIKSDNENTSDFIYDLISAKFINEYISVKDNNDFIEYIISIFRTNIKHFLMNIMKPQSSSRISNDVYLFEPIKEYLNSIEQYSKILIEPLIQSYAINFLNHQNNENKNMNRKNVRNIEQMQNAVLNYLNINYKYIFQKNFIYLVLREKYGFFTKYFKEELNNLSEQIIVVLNDIDFQHNKLVNDIQNKFCLNNNMINNINININNNFANQNYDNDDNRSMASNTIINNNNFNNRMNMHMINDANNFTMNINNNMNINNFNNNFNNMNNINNNMDNFSNINNWVNNNDFINFNNVNCNFNPNLNIEQTIALPSKTEIYFQIEQNKKKE